MSKLWVIDWEFTNLGNPILDTSYLLTVVSIIYVIFYSFYFLPLVAFDFVLLWAMAVNLEKHRDQIKKYIVSFVDAYKHMDLRAYIKDEPLFSIHFGVSMLLLFALSLLIFSCNFSF